MSIANYNIVTSAGLNFVTSAYDSGPLIAIKYFLPVYDYRIDPQIHNGSDTTTMELSASISATDTEPVGEKIYNDAVNTYTLSNTDDFVISASGESLDDSGDPWILTDSVMSKEQKINLANGVPLSNYISGSAVDASATSNAWEIYDGVRVTGSNSEPVAGNGKYFSVVDYYPVLNGDIIKGSFKCRLNSQIGTVKFNKIGLYVVQLNGSGVEISDPVLFAEAVLSSPIIKENYGTDGFDDIVMDVQIQIGSITTNFSDVFFATSADYWNRSPGGLYYPENVGMGVFEDDTQDIQAKCHIKSSATDQLRLDYNSSTSATFNVTSAANLELNMAYGKSLYSKKLADLGSRDYYFNRSHIIQNVMYSLSGINDSDITLYNNLISPSTKSIDLGAVNSKFNNGYFINLSGTTNLYGYDVKVNNSLNPISDNTADIGAYGQGFKNAYIHGVYATSANGTINLAGNISPVTTNIYSVGASNKKVKNLYVNSIFQNDWYSTGVGEWINMGGLYSAGGVSWSLYPAGYDYFYLPNMVFNTTQWDDIIIRDIKSTTIGKKTVVIKFVFEFTKSSTTATSNVLDICQLVPNDHSTESLILQLLEDSDVTTANKTTFEFANSYVNGSPLSLLVEYSGRYGSGDLQSPNYAGGWKFSILNYDYTNNNWKAQRFKTIVTLIHETTI